MQGDQLGSHCDAYGLNPGAGKKALDSGYALNVKSTWFAEALDVGHERVKDDAEGFGVSTVKMKLSSWS